MEKYDLIILPHEWARAIANNLPMPHDQIWTGRIRTIDGKEYLAEFDNAEYIFYVEGYDHVPFSLEQIQRIRVTNEKIDFEKCRKRCSEIIAKKLIDLDSVKQPDPGSIPYKPLQ